MRIVEDPDASHVWLITPAGTFRELTDSEPDGVYETVRPADDRRLFEKVTGGWTITELDGTVHSFDADGKWVSSIDRFGDGPSGTYNGSDQLISVDFPDDREVQLTYHASGKLATMTEVGTDMTSTRTWSYAWSSHDLVQIDRPDGTAWLFQYTEPNHPYMTRQTLLGDDDTTTRIEAAWDYDNTTGFLIDVWAGDANKAATAATDRYSFDRSVPGETTVTDPLGSDTVWTWDEVGGKPRVLSRSGDCPQCGAPNEVSYTYTDTNNPLRPSSMLGPDGVTTSWTYDADSGMPLSKTEDAGGGLERVSTWLYHPAYSGLVRFASRPATDPTCTNIATTTTLPARTTDLIYESGGTGPRLFETVESGCRIVDADTLDLVTFGLSTYRDYTGSSSGLPTSIDPPRLGSSADATTFTLTANDQLIATRTVPDPAAGGATTTYTYDAYNRRIGVTDANGHTTETQYDQLDRVTRVIERSGAFTYGSGPNTGDLATAYAYTTLGDLELIVLPEDNAIFHVYDHIGRLTERHRRATAGGANLERTTWTYDDMGHRTREEHANLVGGTTVTSATEWSYANGCQLNAVVHNPAPFGMGDVVTSYDYDCEGRLWKTWDANHPVGSFPNDYTEYAYDALDRLSSVIQPWGGTGGGDVETLYAYGPQDHLTSVEDGEGNVTTYRYSDRDLLMVEDSPVSGVTRHLYGDGGELTLTRDGRGIDTTRTLDAAGRVTAIAYSGAPGLGVSFTYGSSAMDNEIGRLIGITRHGATIDYEYDEFGRTTRDGGLVFGYDDNGNRASITYPDGLLVEYTFDHADREESLTADPSGENLSVVSAASYLPAGPLSGLTFGNGRSEERAFTGRYFPERITLEPTGGGSALLDWEYETDDIGNPTVIDDLVGSPDRSYAYQPHQYFLTGASGPWPGPLGWTYDRIGNRLSEDRNSVVDTYDYTLNGSSGRTALLETVNLAGGVGGRDYQYTTAGHVTQVDAGTNVVDFLVDEEGRLGGLERVAGDAGSSMLYDGRGFLARVEGFELSSIFRDGFERETTECWSEEIPGPAPSPSSPCSSAFRIVEPVYDSAGLLHALGITETLLGSSTERVLYLAGRPVAIARGDVGALDLLYLTTDHLGTPIAACDDTGTLQWSGGFEPFGTDWLAGTSGGASETGVWLRFPGQWRNSAWEEPAAGAEVSYNVHRWYQPSTGRYSRPDPLGLYDGPNLFSYARASPLAHRDALGLAIYLCSRKAFQSLGGIGNHAYFWDDRKDRFCGIGNATSEAGPTVDECVLVPDSPGREDQLMECCEFLRKNNGVYIPFLNDCQTGAARGLECAGLENPGVPGGRLGPPCDDCGPPPEPRTFDVGATK